MKTFKNYLVEMPAIVDNNDMPVHDVVDASRIRRLLSEKNETLEETEDYILFTTGTKTIGNVVLLNKHRNKIEYEMEYISEKVAQLNNCVTQYYVRSDSRGEYSRDVAYKVVFDYLLKHYRYVVSDEYHTADGKRYWTKLLERANTQNYKIGLIDTHTFNIVWYDRNKSFNRWLEENNGWNSNGYLFRYIITK